MPEFIQPENPIDPTDYDEDEEPEVRDDEIIDDPEPRNPAIEEPLRASSRPKACTTC